ncbi:unnamed protein product [Adineta ricciae]|uniref:Acyltransferase n=1 Tax=Adineta ricciae TaxID=249248 RepID=A0A815T1X5_ADIRI|nr:unnamed protein product [Adineta ricciae]
MILFTFILLCYFWSLSKTLFIALIYGSWMYIDRQTPVRGGRWSIRLRQLYIWSIVSNYFPIKLVKTEDLDPSRNYIFGCHPHGTITLGAGINFLTEATHFSTLFPGIHPHLMALHSNFFFPVLRELILGLGECSVSRESCQYFLNGSAGQGNAVIIVCGGMRELYSTEYEKMTFYLKNRKGFIRLSLENGTSLVPVITFGENEHYWLYKNCISNRFIWGRSIIGYLPLRHPVTTVVGKPIHVKQVISPSQIDIDQLHDQYLQTIEEFSFCVLFRFPHFLHTNVLPDDWHKLPYKFVLIDQQIIFEDNLNEGVDVGGIALTAMANTKSVNQMNRDLRSHPAGRTIERIDPACPERYDRYIHAHFKDGSALYINGEWKHGFRNLTNVEKEWLSENGWILR